MSVVEQEKPKLAALVAKLEGARKEIHDKDIELNDLRNKVVKLEDKSTVESLEKENDDLKEQLKTVSARADAAEKSLEKAQRDLDAAGPALALAEAVRAVK